MPGSERQTLGTRWLDPADHDIIVLMKAVAYERSDRHDRSGKKAERRFDGHGPVHSPYNLNSEVRVQIIFADLASVMGVMRLELEFTLPHRPILSVLRHPSICGQGIAVSPSSSAPARHVSDLRVFDCKLTILFLSDGVVRYAEREEEGGSPRGR